jgi:hypothetical protein
VRAPQVRLGIQDRARYRAWYTAAGTAGLLWATVLSAMGGTHVGDDAGSFLLTVAGMWGALIFGCFGFSSQQLAANRAAGNSPAIGVPPAPIEPALVTALTAVTLAALLLSPFTLIAPRHVGADGCLIFAVAYNGCGLLFGLWLRTVAVLRGNTP